MKETVEKKPVTEFIPLSDDDFAIISSKRKKALGCLERLHESGLPAFTYGSICRGDIREQSDIDIFIPRVVPSFRVELALEKYNFEERLITQATPNHTIKGIIQLDTDLSVGFPLTPLKPLEEDFYVFAGKLDRTGLKNDLYVAGVNKRLEFISMETASKGYWKESLAGLNPLEVAKKLGTALAIVEERIRVLTIRDEKGRKGIFLKKVVTDDFTFEQELKHLADRNPVVRRYLARF
ncbi:MAG: nucleotidyltransferase domain-containing protein [Candidatus Odinarchaeota archaeon]